MAGGLQANARSPRTQPLTADVVLAALARALHSGPIVDGGVWLSEVSEHLGLSWHGATSRRLQPIMTQLVDRGLVRHSNKGSIWALTDTGYRQAQRVTVLLPESPQHRLWRQACELATEHHPRMRQRFITAVKAACDLINAEEPAAPSSWIDCKHELEHACEALAQVAYILNRAEPDDATPDLDSRAQPAGARLGWEVFWAEYGLVVRHNTIGLGKKTTERRVERLTDKA